MIGCEACEALPLAWEHFKCEKRRTVQVGSDLGFSTVSNGEQFLFVIEKLLSCFCRKLLILGYLGISVKAEDSSRDGTYFQRWHLLGRLPDRTHSRYTWSYQCLHEMSGQR
jgi:hypothetical protein